MAESRLITESLDFAVAVVGLCDRINGRGALTNQLLRSGTSIGANIHEANYAHGRADFIAKLQIALKECYETEYWLTSVPDRDHPGERCKRAAYRMRDHSPPPDLLHQDRKGEYPMINYHLQVPH